MTVAREVKQAVGAHIGETLVALGIDLRTQVLQGTVLVFEVDAPDVGATLPARHVAGKVEPVAVRADKGVTIVAQGVGRNLKLLRSVPFGLAARAGVDFHIGGPVLAHGASKIHRRAVGRERGSTLVMLGIQAAFHHLGACPGALLVLLREVDVTLFGTRNLAAQLTRRFLIGRCEVEVLHVLVQIHGAVVGTA